MDVSREGIKVFKMLFIFILASVIKASDTKHDKHNRAMAPLRYSGCYGGCGKFTSFFISHTMVNEDCVNFCGQKAFVYAATRRNFCGCTNSIESLLPIFDRPSEYKQSGVKSRFRKWCPGTKASKKVGLFCSGDYCCGGKVAYSLFTVGEMDVAKELVKRIFDSITFSDLNHIFQTNLSNASMNTIQFKLVIKKRLKDGFRICEKTDQGIICRNIQKHPATINPLSFRQITYKRESQHRIPLAFRSIDYLEVDYFMNTGGYIKRSFDINYIASTTNVIEGGFDTFISTSESFENDQNLMLSGATTTGTRVARLMLNISADLPARIQFFKSRYQLSVRWRSAILASGNIEIKWGGETKLVDLKKLLFRQQRTFYTAGVLSYIEPKITYVVVKVVNGTGKETHTKPIQATVNEMKKKSVKETEADDARAPCGSFKKVNKCQHRLRLNLYFDKKLECETKYDGKEVCSLLCAGSNRLLGNKEEKYTTIVCPSGSSEETERMRSALKELEIKSDSICKGTM